MAFKDLNAHQRIVAVNTDYMRHPDFAILGGVTQIGQVFIDDLLPTAGTDGCDVHYCEEFIMQMTRKQLRYLVGHEQLHKSLHHCTDYNHIKEKYPEEFAQGVDYVVNGMLEAMDIKKDFLERPTTVPPLIDPKFDNKSLPEVVRMLIQEKQQDGGGGRGKPMDVHMSGAGQGSAEEVANGKGLKQQIEDAVAQGALVQEQLRAQRGDGAGGSDLSGFQERVTDWRTPMRRFMQELCEGDEQSRFSPPNKRLLPLDIILPSHFSEATGELIVACDTSGSMHGLYSIVFGEIARIAQNVLPTSIRVIWWDTQVAGEQVFTPRDYDKLAKAMHPKGGGGTTVSCVARHIREKRYKPKAVIYLTDGYIESSYEVAQGNVLWGIVGNKSFRPIRGKVLHIEEV